MQVPLDCLVYLTRHAGRYEKLLLPFRLCSHFAASFPDVKAITHTACWDQRPICGCPSDHGLVSVHAVNVVLEWSQAKFTSSKTCPHGRSTNPDSYPTFPPASCQHQPGNDDCCASCFHFFIYCKLYLAQEHLALPTCCAILN